MTTDTAILRTGGRDVGHSNFLRQVARQPSLLVASLFAGFAVGVAYRFLFDPAVERDLINFVRSGLQGAGVALAVLAVQIGFASGAQYRLGSTLRRLPLPGELVVRAVVMAAAVIDLITRFFFDIDGPIRDYGGAVHAYVGDEVIVSWPVTADPARNARCVLCFLAIERKMARLAADYGREFEVVPALRAGVHAGPVIVSECGDTKRQLAYFGDTMNVAARLCEHCKAVDQQLVVSGDLLHLMMIPGDLVGEGKSIAVRGRREQVAVHVVNFT